MVDYIEQADSPLESSHARYLTPRPSTFRNFQQCPWAKTLVVRDHETNHLQVRPVTCKRWGCAFCAPRKIRKMAFLTNAAKPNRWIRLGVKPDLYQSPRQCWEITSPHVPELFRKLRKTYGEIEYLRVCELHQGTTRYSELKKEYKAIGFPHYHCLLRCKYIRQKDLSDAWASLGSAPVVYIAKIDQTFSSFRYLTKYLTKLHRIEWTDRHVSYSKNFFPEEAKEKLAYPTRDVLYRDDEHPWKFVADRYSWEQVVMGPEGEITLPTNEITGEEELQERTQDYPLRDFGIETSEPEPIREEQPTQSELQLESTYSTSYEQPF